MPDDFGPELEDEHPDLAALEQPPAIVPDEPVVEGPAPAPGAADTFIDQTIAQPPIDESKPLPDLPGNVPNVPAPDGSPAPEAKPTDATPESVEAGKRQLLTDQARTLADKADADADAATKRKLDQDLAAAQAKLDRDDATTRLQEAQQRLAKERYDAAHPRQTFRDKIFVALAGIGGALAAAKSAAGGGSAENMGLRGINEKLRRETDAAQERIRNASDAVVQARAGVKDADEARLILERDADARDLNLRAEAEAALKRDLMRQGITGAALDSDARMIQIRRDRAAAIEAAKDHEVARKLKTAQAAEASGKAALAQRKAGGGGAGGGHSAALDELVADPRRAPDVQRKYGLTDQKLDKLVITAAKLRADGGKGEAAQEKEEATLVRDDAGNPIGHVPTGRGGAQGFATRDADYGRALTQLEALKADVDANGARVVNPESWKRRNTLYHNAVIGVATVSPLGKTNEAMEAEAGSLGSSGAGAGAISGANPEAIARKIEELKEQRERYRKETLIPLKGGARPAAAASSPPAAAAAAKADPGKVARARAIVDDPKVPDGKKVGARAFLAASGG